MGLPDAIAEAFIGLLQKTFQGIAEELSTSLTDEAMKGLLRVPNPYDSSAAGNAWTGVFEISMVLLPIAIAISLIAWPFSEDREGGLMELAVRVVMVIFFIGISQPAWGFAIDATNAVTVAILNLDPNPGPLNYGFNNDLTGASLTFTGWAFKFVVSVCAAILVVLSLFLSLFFLLLRWFMVWMAYVGTPFFAIVWFLGRGPLKAAGDVGATFLRMGLFSLLAGPVIAIVVLAFQVIEQGGILQTVGNGPIGNAGLYFAELALILLFPVMLIVAVWKLISWAGQPIGVGEAASVASLTVAGLAGAAVTGGVSAVAGAGGGAASAGASEGAAASGAAGATSGAAKAGASSATASAGTSAASATPGAGGSGLANRIGGKIQAGAANFATRGVQKIPGGETTVTKVQSVQGSVDSARDRISVDSAQDRLDTAKETASQVQNKSQFLTKAINEQTLDLDEANELNVLPQAPADGAEPDVFTNDETGETVASYQGENGSEQSVNLSQEVRNAGDDLQKADQDAAAKESSLKSLKRANTAAHYGKAGSVAGAKIGARTGSATFRAGAGALVGGASGNSYLAYSAGQNAATPMIRPSQGSGTPVNQNPNHTLDEYGKTAAGQAAPAMDHSSER
jgi:type IV secretion system protein TrbL